MEHIVEQVEEKALNGTDGFEGSHISSWPFQA